MTTYTISRNDQFNSIEVLFNGKPSEAVREALKAMRFRWHGVKKVWYGYKTEEETRQAIDSADGKTATKVETKKAAEKVNKFGVKVGDLFSATWGYDQTNVDFFQVIALVGETSVRVREVSPEILEEKAIGPMSSDFVYKTNTEGKLLPARSSSVFIKDQEKGDLKRLKSYDSDGKSNPLFNISSFANAYYCTGETQEEYVSWYA